MNRKSMGEIISKLLLFNDENDENFTKKKMDLLTRVLEELKITKEQDKYECICSMLEGAFYNKTFVSEFMKEQKYIEILYNILDESKEQPKKLIALMKLLIRINENILKNIEGRCTPVLEQENPMEIINMFSNNYTLEDNNKEVDPEMEQNIKNVITNLINSLEKNKFIFLDDLDDCSSKENSEFNTTYQILQKRLGMKKLAQIELFRSILDVLVNAYAKYNIEESLKVINIIKEKKIFPKVNKLFFDFPFCNLNQAYYSQIIDIVLNEFSPELLIEIVFGDKDENLIQKYIDSSLNNMKFTFSSNKTAFHPNFLFEVSLLNKIFTSKNEHLKNLIKDNKNLEIFNKVLGEEVNDIFEQKLLLTENDIQFNSNAQDDAEEKKPNVYFGKKNFMELIEEDAQIFKIFLAGGDYEKALNDKKEKEKTEKEALEKEKEMEENKKAEEDAYYNNEEEEQDDKKNLKDSVNNLDQEDEENDEKKNENENINENENENQNENEKENEKDNENNEEEKEKEKEKTEENKEESSSEETEESKKFNEVNFWKPEIVPDDNIMSAVLNGLD